MAEPQPLLKPLAGYSRPRRATLDTESARRPVITSTGHGPRPVVHASPIERSPSLTSRPHRPEPDAGYYLTPAVSSRGHRRSFSTDTSGGAGRYTRQIEGPDEYSHRPSVDRGDEYRNPAVPGARKGYHLSGPLVRHPNVDSGQHGYDAYGGYGYGSTDPEEAFYRDPPANTRRRGESIETPPRRERPLSMVNLENYPPRVAGSREPGPYLAPHGLERSAPMVKAASADRRLHRGSVDDPARRYDFTRPQPYEELPIRAARQAPVLHHERDPAYPSHRDGVAEPRERRRERVPRDDDYDEPYAPRRHQSHHHHHQSGQIPSVESSPYQSSDFSSDPDEGTHRRPRRHRHRDEGVAAAMLAGDKISSSGREKPEKDARERDVRDRDRERERERDRERRERKTKESGGSDKPSRGDRERRERDPAEREARKREHRERPEREQGARDREQRERRPRDRDSTGGAGEEAPIVDLRDRDPRERDHRDREPTGDDKSGSGSGKQKVRVVSPPREREKEVKEVKGILRQPRDKFPEDPEPVREGVAPLKEALKDGKKGIPPGARWTKVDRKLVNPAALDEAQERYEERIDHVIVLRVLTREEIEKLAARTQEIRGR